MTLKNLARFLSGPRITTSVSDPSARRIDRWIAAHGYALDGVFYNHAEIWYPRESRLWAYWRCVFGWWLEAVRMSWHKEA